jgi:hypothetical protein
MFLSILVVDSQEAEMFTKFTYELFKSGKFSYKRACVNCIGRSGTTTPNFEVFESSALSA